MIELNGKKIIISRTDSIGDVVLTLPIVSEIKAQFPQSKIVFLGKKYTKDILSLYEGIDEVACWDDVEHKSTQEKVEFIQNLKADVFLHVFLTKELAQIVKKAKVKYRVGTSHRLFNLLNCNYKVNFTRKNSDLHEAQLNFKLLSPFGIMKTPTMEELVDSMNLFREPHSILPADLEGFIKDYEFVIFHPKSQGSALEWPIEKYVQLCHKLISEKKKVIFTGTEKEGLLFRGMIPNSPFVFDSTGKLSLMQLIKLISISKGLVACSTGPLHLAAAYKRKAVGLFVPRTPIHPGRWKPIGPKANAIVYDKNCNTCKSGKKCNCIAKIDIEMILPHLE